MKDVLHLTLEQKIGQLFVLGFQGGQPDLETRELLDAIGPGGFVLSQRNIESFDQIYELTSGLRNYGAIAGLLAIDHEGGRVDRLKQLFGPMPSMADLAELGIAQLRMGARVIAAELEATGFNLALAPVLDLRSVHSIMYERCLAEGPLEVARLGGAFAEELSKRGILICLRHFPGLGGATADPHFSLPRVDRTKRQLQNEDLMPFVKLFDRSRIVMVSHAHYTAFGDDKPTPASLSPRVVTGLLRKKLAYQGVVITDDLSMGAVTRTGLTPETFLRAFESGSDLLLFSKTTPLVEKAFRLILRAARSSATLRSRVDESVERILMLKRGIQFVPLRYRTQLKTHIARQVEKLQKSVPQVAARGLTV